MRLRGPRSLRVLLIAQFLLVVAVAIAITALLLLQWRLPVARQQTEAEVARVADLALSQLDRTLDNAEALAQALAQVVQGRLFLGQPLQGDGEFHQLLTYLAGSSGLFDAIYLIDNQNKVRAMALHADVTAQSQEALGNDFSGVAVVQQARTGWNLVWSDQFLSPVQARPVVAVVVPLTGGMVMLEMAVERLSGFAQGPALRDNLLLLVVDSKGEAVAAPNAALVRQRTNLADQALVRAAMNNEAVYGALTYDGEAYVGTSRRSPRLGWGLVVAYPRAVVDAPVRAGVLISVVTLMLSLGMGVLMASALARRLDGRINDTLEYAAAIARGDYSVTARPSGLLEIDRIQGSLARMAVTIEAREKALAAQERQFRELVENTADLVVYFDGDARIIYSNPSADNTLLPGGGSLIGCHLMDHVQPDELPSFQRWIEHARTSTRNSYHGEVRMRTSRGQQHHVAWSTSVDREADGRIKGYRCIGLDVTRQRAAQEALRRSETRLRAIIDGSPALAIQWYDREGQVVDWNPASEAMFGWSREEALGHTLDRLIYTPQQQADFVRMLAEVEQTGRYAGPYESVAHGRNGQVVMVLSTTFQIPGDADQPLFVCMDLDITDRKRAEAELLASERRFQLMFDANPVPLAVMRRDGDDFVYADVNQAWVRALGYAREDVIGQSRSRLTVMADPQEIAALRERLDREHVVAANHTLLRRADGSTFISEGVVGLVDSEDGQLLIYSVNDVTELREAQAKLRQLNAELEERIAQRTESLTLANTELEQALMTLQLAQGRLVAQQDRLVQAEKLASLGSLVAGVAHELNTPIGNGLMAMSTLHDRVHAFETKMAGGLKRSDLEAFLRHAATGCEIAVRNLHRASELVTSFKQVAVDQTSDQRREFEIREVVDEILLTLQPTLKRTSHQVVCEVPDGVPMDSFPGALGQVLTNLVQNALIHGLDGLENGRIEVRVRRDGADALVLSVADSGHGIPEAMQRQVFDPFFTTKLGHGGSGLGLPIVRNIVTGVLGGEIDFHNRAEGGVEFVVRLPLRAPQAGGSEAAVEPDPAQEEYK